MDDMSMEHDSAWSSDSQLRDDVEGHLRDQELDKALADKEERLARKT